jgi:hypothetical protein
MTEVATKAVVAWGTAYYRQNDAGGWDEILEITDFGDGPQMVAEEKDVSHSNSPGMVREFKRTWRNPNEFTIQKNWDATDPITTLLFADEASGDTRNFKAVYSNGEGDIFPAYVKQVKKMAPLDGVLQIGIVLRVAGATTSI